MNLKISPKISVSDFKPTDKTALVEHLQEKQIYDQTCAIPYPYTEKDADSWLDHVTQQTQKQGRSVNWAIRNSENELVGGIGFHDFQSEKSHRAEIGYWLAKSYWGKGIMTPVVDRITQFGFEDLGLLRIMANVFAFNTASIRILEKLGYELEGVLRKHYKKDGKIFDGKLYARLKS